MVWFTGFSRRLTKICLYRCAFKLDNWAFFTMPFSKINFSSYTLILSIKLNNARNFASVFTPKRPTYNLNWRFSDFESDLTKTNNASLCTFVIVIKKVYIIDNKVINYYKKLLNIVNTVL